jgi:hypothetical protein
MNKLLKLIKNFIGLMFYLIKKPPQLLEVVAVGLGFIWTTKVVTIITASPISIVASYHPAVPRQSKYRLAIYCQFVCCCLY